MMGVFVQVNEQGKNATRNPIGYVVQENGCWEWVGLKSLDGYGRWKVGGKYRMAHRITFERVRGAIDPALSIDHLCRNRACVNPDHLEQVSIGVNVLRGNNRAARNARKTHCHRGHPFSPENTECVKAGERRCITCRRQNDREFYRRNSIAQDLKD